MVRHLGSSLVDVMYVFDEPTIGLHPRDVGRMNALLHRLRDKGNTVLVVEHDTDVITAADHVVELGPRAGTHGGTIVYQGDVAGLASSGTLTGEFLHRAVRAKDASPHADRARCRPQTPPPTTCAGFDLDVPLGVLVAITGVAGLRQVDDGARGAACPQHPDAIVVDQSAVATNIRSTPATWTGRHGPDPQALRQADGHQAGAVQLQLRRRLPHLQRARRGLRRPRVPRRGALDLRRLRRPPLHRGGPRAHRRREVDLRRPGPDGGRRASSSSPAATSGPSSRHSSTSGWGT